MVRISINDAQHPSRQKAIAVMEFIATYLRKPKLFDCKNGNTKWYDVEDKLTNIINEK